MDVSKKRVSACNGDVLAEIRDELQVDAADCASNEAALYCFVAARLASALISRGRKLRLCASPRVPGLCIHTIVNQRKRIKIYAMRIWKGHRDNNKAGVDAQSGP